MCAWPSDPCFAVGPTHDHLEGRMKTAQLHRAWNLDHSPDRWVNADERDSQSVDRRRGLLRGHRNIVRQVVGLALWRCSRRWHRRVHRNGFGLVWVDPVGLEGEGEGVSGTVKSQNEVSMVQLYQNPSYP